MALILLSDSFYFMWDILKVQLCQKELTVSHFNVRAHAGEFRGVHTPRFVIQCTSDVSRAYTCSWFQGTFLHCKKPNIHSLI